MNLLRHIAVASPPVPNGSPVKALCGKRATVTPHSTRPYCAVCVNAFVAASQVSTKGHDEAIFTLSRIQDELDLLAEAQAPLRARYERLIDGGVA